MATTLELNGPKSIRRTELSVLADGPLLGLDVISGEATFIFLILKNGDTGSEAHMLADQTPTATPATEEVKVNPLYLPLLEHPLKATCQRDGHTIANQSALGQNPTKWLYQANSELRIHLTYKWSFLPLLIFL